ncbi:MAG: DUF6498-containing protein [Pseudomonadales bacterium]|jgi:hypothetical protein|nr:DUF6498-containing protein [Pseudomonadales bacterium]
MRLPELSAASQNLVDARRLASLLALILVNLLPVLGVLVWHWEVGSLLVLYWSENLIIGGFTLLKLIVNRPVGGSFAALFFLIHYGGFCAVHGLFVLLLATDTEPSFIDGAPWPFFLVFVQLLVSVVRQVLAMAPPEWVLAFAALVLSHGLSLGLNYFGNGEYRGQTTQTLMRAPYGRIMVLHVALLAGGWAVLALGSPLPLLVVLVLLKLGLDVRLHRREHRRTTAAAAEAAPAGSSAA